MTNHSKLIQTRRHKQKTAKALTKEGKRAKKLQNKSVKKAA